MKAMMKKSGRILQLSIMVCLIITLTNACQQKESHALDETMAKLKILLQQNPSTVRVKFIEWLQADQRHHISENQLDSLGYQLIKKNQIEQAVSVFRISVELFPDSWKAWDSLGEGLMYLQNKDQSRQAYQRSLAINPENRNASKQLRNLEEFMDGMAGETEAIPRFSPGESTGIDQPYFGQDPPAGRAEIFAPGIVSTRGNLEYSCTFSPDGREMFFTARIGKNMARLFYSKWAEDGWTFPEIPAFSGGHIDYLPYIMPDGRRMFFGRIAKDENGAVTGRGFYAMDKKESEQFSWSEPYLFTDGENWMHVSASSDLTIYTTYLLNHRTARFRLINGKYAQMEATEGGLHPGAHPCIAPDESYIIFDSERTGGLGKSDLWLCFRKSDGIWGPAINLGEKVNTAGNESIPHLTADGRYLFYTSNRDIYWVDTQFLEAFSIKMHSVDGD